MMIIPKKINNARRPRVATRATASTASAGSAVSFMFITTAMASPEVAGPAKVPLRNASAAASTTIAITGMSSPAATTVSSVSGLTTASCAASTGTFGHPRTFSASRTAATAPTANQTRASVNGPSPNSARGRPKIVIAGP
jgi:hypothetical protein